MDAFQLFENFKTIHFWHFQICKQEIIMMSLNQMKCFLTFFNSINGITVKY